MLTGCWSKYAKFNSHEIRYLSVLLLIDNINYYSTLNLGTQCGGQFGSRLKSLAVKAI